jgi:hypothetical protein
MVDGAAAAFDVYMKGIRLSPGNPKLESRLSEVRIHGLGFRLSPGNPNQKP